MTVAYTPNGGYHKPAFNHQNWDVEWRDMAEIIDEALHGYTSVSLTAGNVNLTIPDGATGDGRHRVIEFTGTPGASRQATLPDVEGWWIFKNSTGSNVTIQLTSGGNTVVLSGSRQAIVFSTGSDLAEVIQLGTDSTKLLELSGYLSDKQFKYAFETFDLGLWTQFQSDGSNVFSSKEESEDPGFPGVYGKGWGRLVAKAAFYWTNKLPFNPNALYRVRFAVRQRVDGSAGENHIYLGVTAFDDAGNVVGLDGTNNESASNLHSVAAHDADIEGQTAWQYFEGYFKGVSSAPSAQGKTTLNDPGQLHEDARYFSPMFWLNDANTNGTADIALVQVEQLEEQPVADVSVRQTVLAGETDANGYANFITAGTGLAADLNAAAADCIIAFANGFGPHGAVDYLAAIRADQANYWSGLSSNDTCYLYVDRDPTTGVITAGFIDAASNAAPQYGYAHPAGPASGDHSFLIPEMKMYEYDGAAWQEKQRVFLGEVDTDGASVTAARTYALRGEYYGPLNVNLSGQDVRVSENHYIGVNSEFVMPGILGIVKTPQGGYVAGDVFHPFPNVFSQGYLFSDRLTVEVEATGASGLVFLQAKRSGTATDSFVNTEADFRLTAKRMF